MSSYTKMNIEAARARETQKDHSILETQCARVKVFDRERCRQAIYGRIQLGCLITHSTLRWGKPITWGRT